MNKSPQKMAQELSSYGRHGDSMLLHVNPLEVQGLASLGPVTVNPDTGQPEAFAFLGPLLSMVAPSLLGGTALGATLGTAGTAALAGGIGTTLETGSLEQGLLSGLGSFGLGQAMQGAGDLLGTQAAEKAITSQITPDALTGMNPDLAKNLVGTDELLSQQAEAVINQMPTNAIPQSTDAFINKFGGDAISKGVPNTTADIAKQAYKSVPRNMSVLGQEGGTKAFLGQAMSPKALMPIAAGFGGQAIQADTEAFEDSQFGLAEEKRKEQEELMRNYQEQIPGMSRLPVSGNAPRMNPNSIYRQGLASGGRVKRFKSLPTPPIVPDPGDGKNPPPPPPELPRNPSTSDWQMSPFYDPYQGQEGTRGRGLASVPLNYMAGFMPEYQYITNIQPTATGLGAYDVDETSGVVTYTGGGGGGLYPNVDLTNLPDGTQDAGQGYDPRDFVGSTPYNQYLLGDVERGLPSYLDEYMANHPYYRYQDQVLNDVWGGGGYGTPNYQGGIGGMMPGMGMPFMGGGNQFTPFDPSTIQFPDYTDRFAGYDTRFGGYDERLGGYDERLGGFDTRFGDVDTRFGNRVGVVDQNFVDVNRRIDEILAMLGKKGGGSGGGSGGSGGGSGGSGDGGSGDGGSGDGGSGDDGSTITTSTGDQNIKTGDYTDDITTTDDGVYVTGQSTSLKDGDDNTINTIEDLTGGSDNLANLLSGSGLSGTESGFASDLSLYDIANAINNNYAAATYGDMGDTRQLTEDEVNSYAGTLGLDPTGDFQGTGYTLADLIRNQTTATDNPDATVGGSNYYTLGNQLYDGAGYSTPINKNIRLQNTVNMMGYGPSYMYRYDQYGNPIYNNPYDSINLGYAEGGDVQLTSLEDYMQPLPASMPNLTAELFKEKSAVPPKIDQVEKLMQNPVIQEKMSEGDRELLKQASLVILGRLQDDGSIIQKFVELFGEEAYERLKKELMPNMQTEGLIQGEGGGMDDMVNGELGDQEKVALSPGEFIVPADAVSDLGDGNNEQGANYLQQLVNNIRQQKHGTTEQPAPINLNEVMPI